MAQRLKTDWTLFLTVVLMVAFGLVIVYSASSAMAELRYNSENYSFALRQLLWAVPSLVLLMFCKKFDYRRFRSPRVVFTALGIVMSLLVVAFVADSNAHRWVRVGPGGLQPSEFAKPALCLFLAYFLSKRDSEVNSRKALLPICIVIGFLTVAVGIGDFGTSMLLVLTTGAVLYVAGLNWKYIAMAMAVVLMFGVVEIVAKPYRLSRVIGFLDPDGTRLDVIDGGAKIRSYASSSLSTRDTGYQGHQSRISLGSGGVVGNGIMHSKQKLLFLPEAHTDFIYAVIGEELGLLGCVAVLVGFVIILWRGFRLVRTAPDSFGRYLALSLTSAILIQALINISVVLDMGPTKGFPLPLISYGGSSLMSTLVSMGLLLSVSEQAG